ncbi:zinc finger protein 540-like [Tachysurus ichikawai]
MVDSTRQSIQTFKARESVIRLVFREDDKRARLRGGGRKKASEELEVSVCEWIHSMRAKHLRVSRKMIRAKAKEVYATKTHNCGPERCQALHYDNWMSGDVDKEYTAGGNMRAPARHLLVSWVLQAWEKLVTERLKNSFKVCGLTVASDGSEDHLIHCFKEGEPCTSGRELLVQARQAELAEAGEEEVEESDEEEEFANELVIEDHGDDDSDE